MTMFALCQRVALTLCPELGRALTKARSDVARLKASFEQGDAVFRGHCDPVLPVVGATDGSGCPGPGIANPVAGRGEIVARPLTRRGGA